MIQLVEVPVTHPAPWTYNIHFMHFWYLQIKICFKCYFCLAFWRQMYSPGRKITSCSPLLPFEYSGNARLCKSEFWMFIWTASSEFGTYSLCEQRRFRRACASAQSRQNLRCSLIQAVSQEEPSDRKPDPWPLWMTGHAQLKFGMTECSKTQIRLTGLI